MVEVNWRGYVHATTLIKKTVCIGRNTSVKRTRVYKQTTAFSPLQSLCLRTDEDSETTRNLKKYLSNYSDVLTFQ